MRILFVFGVLSCLFLGCDRYRPSHEEIPDVPSQAQSYSLESLRLVERMIEQYPNEPAYKYKKGLMLSEKKDWIGAIDALKQALRYDSLNPRYRIALSKAHHAQGDYKFALQMIHKILPKLDNDFQALLLAGELFCRNKDYDNAVKHLNKALRLTPHEADVYYWKGVVALTRLDTAVAIRNLNQTLKLKPKHALAYNAFAEMYNRYEIYTIAIDFANKGLAYEALPELYFTKAEAFRLRRFAEDSARANYQKVYALNRKFYWASYHLGKYAYDIGKFEEAKKYFESALREESNLAYANYYLGMCLRFRGERESALKKFALAMKQDSKLFVASEAYWALSTELQQDRYARYEDSLRRVGLPPDTTRR